MEKETVIMLLTKDMRELLLMTRGRAKESIILLMGMFMKGIGRIMLGMGVGYLFFQLGMSMMDNGKQINNQAKAPTPTLTAQSTPANSKTICSTVTVSSNTKTATATKANG